MLKQFHSYKPALLLGVIIQVNAFSLQFFLDSQLCSIQILFRKIKSDEIAVSIILCLKMNPHTRPNTHRHGITTLKY